VSVVWFWFVFLKCFCSADVLVSVFLYPLFYSPFSRGDLNKPGVEALTVVIITVNSLYLIGGVFLLFKALAIEAGVGDKFASIRNILSNKKLIFTHNAIHANGNETMGGEAEEQETATNNSNKNNKGKKNNKSKSKSKSKGGPKMVEMISQRGDRPMRRPTAEIFEGADIHSNPLNALHRMRRGGGGEGGGEVKTKSQTGTAKLTAKPTAMVGFGGFGTAVLAGKKWKKKAAAAAKRKKERLEKEMKGKKVVAVEEEVREEVEDVVPSIIVHRPSGRRYYFNKSTGESDWIDKEEDVDIRVEESSGKRYGSVVW